MEERKPIKFKNSQHQVFKIKERLQLKYSIKDEEIKKSARHDKTANVDNIVMKVETTAENGDMNTVYRLAKHGNPKLRGGSNTFPKF